MGAVLPLRPRIGVQVNCSVFDRAAVLAEVYPPQLRHDGDNNAWQPLGEIVDRLVRRISARRQREARQ